MVAVVEQTTLPHIVAEAKQSEWTGYVNAYVTGRYATDMANGSWRKDLWYLSYVLPKGQGAIGWAIASTFFSNTGAKSIAIEGIGGVCLGSQRQDLQSLGYKVHWNYRMEPLGPDAIQCIVEPLMLTSFDPQLAETSNKRARRGAKSGSGKSKSSEVTSLSTAPSSSSMEHQEAEITRREQKPMFLLLIPGVRTGDQEYLEQLHLAYLRKRCPFDLHEEWASMLWKRAGEKNEVRELSAWSYVYAPSANPEDFAILSLNSPSHAQPKDTTPVDMPKEESPFQAVISQAFLCLPDIEGIHTSLLNTIVLQREKEEVAA